MHARDLSPVEYTRALLDRIARFDPGLNAFLWLRPEAALDAARAAEEAVMRGDALGPLHGVPYALKDIVDAEGWPTTCHSRLLADNVAAADSAVAARLRAAGGILIGKLATHEFAIGGPSFDLPWPPARNPWNRDPSPGGSSSGAGAAVAAGFVPIAIGSDTGGSVRNPATMCSLVGMKATYGRVSRRGVFPLSFSLDHVGPLTRTVADNALALSVIAGFDPGDPASGDAPVPDYAAALDGGIAGLRIGVIRHFHQRDMVADPEMAAAIERGIAVLAGLGAEIVEVETHPLGAFADVNRLIQLSEAFAVHERWLAERPQDYGALTRERLLPGAYFRAVDYVQALRVRSQYAADMGRTMHGLDALVTACNMDPPYRIDDEQGMRRCYPRHARTPFNLTGLPCVALPAGRSSAGLPLGFQLAGQAYGEATLYRIAAAYEQAVGVPEWPSLEG